MVDAAGILFWCPADGTVLCVQRGDEGSEAGTWTPPGGGREAGESLYQTAVREAHEELALPRWPKTTTRVGMVRAGNGFTTFIEAVSKRWKSRVGTPPGQRGEVARVAWLPVEVLGGDARAYLHPGFAEVLPKIEPIMKSVTGSETEVNGRPTGPGEGYGADRSFENAYHLSGPNPGIRLRSLQPWDGWGPGIV